MTWQPIKTCPIACMVLLAREGQNATMTGMKLYHDMFISGSMPYVNPTHWMYLPEPPIKVEGA